MRAVTSPVSELNNWTLRPVGFRYQISDWTLFSLHVPLQARIAHLSDLGPADDHLVPPAPSPAAGSEGYVIRSLPVHAELPELSRAGNYICYVPLQYPHCYIDLTWTFEQYLAKFSGKTRSSIQRKIRKYSEHCAGELKWKTYKDPIDVREFFRLARQVSRLTYQERLLDVGLPEDQGFVEAAEALAAKGGLRAYLLFHGERPVSYLYCPEKDNALIYAYLGYDPEYQHLSVGTILQWLAIEQIFAERRFQIFDFTEGLSSHKQLFSSHQRLCANVYFLRRTLRNGLIVRSHIMMNGLSKWLGEALDRYGLKTRLRKLLRRI